MANVCRHCKQAKENMYSFGKSVQYECRECKTEYQRRYRMTEKGKAATLRAVRKYEERHPERRSAWRDVAEVPLEPCHECGKMPTHRHHPDVSKTQYIIFLCPLHHKRAHNLV